MGRLGKRGKKPAAGKAAADDKQADAAAGWNKAANKAAAMGPTGGFTEKDIEFMKKAIQVLC